jgi:hypothetical protein
MEWLNLEGIGDKKQEKTSWQMPPWTQRCCSKGHADYQEPHLQLQHWRCSKLRRVFFNVEFFVEKAH